MRWISCEREESTRFNHTTDDIHGEIEPRCAETSRDDAVSMKRIGSSTRRRIYVRIPGPDAVLIQFLGAVVIEVVTREFLVFERSQSKTVPRYRQRLKGLANNDFVAASSPKIHQQ